MGTDCYRTIVRVTTQVRSIASMKARLQAGRVARAFADAIFGARGATRPTIHFSLS